MTVFYNLSGHLSSIRAFAKENMMENNSCLLVSVGGRAQMMIWKVKNDDISKNCLSVWIFFPECCHEIKFVIKM